MSTEIYDRLRAVEMDNALNQGRLDSHEKVCAERYQNIDLKINHTNQQLDRLVKGKVWENRLFVGTAITVIGFFVARWMGA